MITGVYLIRNLHTGAVYVGSSSHSIARRWREHRSCLIGGRHCNPRLQNAWNKYGADMFAWEVLEHAEGRDAVLACEQRWIDHYWGGRMGVNCYNMLPTAGSTAGRIISPETRAKMRAAARERVASPETRAKMSAASRGHVKSPETRAKLSARIVSPETRAKLSAATSAANRVRIISPETRAKHRAAGRGRVKSPETLAKLRARTASPETRAKLRAVQRERRRKLQEKATYHQASLFDLAE